MADANPRDEAVAELGYSRVTDGTFLGALSGDIWDKWTAAVKSAALPHPDKQDSFDTVPAVPLIVYGDGPNDYVSTDIDAGQVIVRDGNDRTGKAWLFPAADFYRFAARLRGEKLKDDDKAEGDNPVEAARKLAERTAKLVEADRDATKEAKDSGEGTTATTVRAKVNADRAKAAESGASKTSTDGK